MFIFLDETSINTFLDVAFHLVDLVLRSWVATTPHYRAPN